MSAPGPFERIDEKFLGSQGATIIVTVIAVLLVAGAVTALAKGAWGNLVIEVVLAAWAIYWSVIRWRRFLQR